MSNENKDPNYKFECQRCGTCCSLYCIPCTDKDIRRILTYLKVPPDRTSDFAELVEPDEEILYSYEDVPKVLVDDIDSTTLLLVLKSDSADKYCCFFDQDKNRCNIYPVRPLVCRYFPFVYEYEEEKEIDLIDDPENITFSVYEESKYCKGFKKGKEFDFDKLREVTIQTIQEDQEFEKKVHLWNLKFIFYQIKNCDEEDFLQYLLNFKD